MKLRNKKTGEVDDILFATYAVTGNLSLSKMDENSENGYEDIAKYKTLSELNDEWEDYTPREPLIKHEKIRKAIKAWADLNDIKYIEPCARSNKDNYRIVGFNAVGRSFTMEISNEYECRITMGQASSRKMRNAYTITELCGEEEE